MLTLNDGRTELWQWDTGRTLAVDADCSQVHFSSKVFGRSIDVDVVDGVAIIPDTLLQTDKELTAWAFVGTPENGYTKISKVFKVNRRNKPADYVFTPIDQTTLQEIEEKIKHLESIEFPVTSVNKKTGDVKLNADDVGAISQEDLQVATDAALSQAKESGLFDGADGHTPEYGVDYGTPQQISGIAKQAAVILADDIKKISDGKVDKVEGMGLSTNDYDNAAKTKVDAIPENPKYSDTVYDDTEVKKVLNQIKSDLANKYKKPSDGIPESDLSAGVTAKLHHILTLTQAEYDSIAIPEPDTYYCITEEP